MARIAVLGGTGYAGAAVVAEARRRGHDVTAVSRTAPATPVDGATYVEGYVVVSALSPRGDMAGKVEGVVEDLVARVAGTTTRLGYIGGASSLLTEEGGPSLWDVSKDQVPDEVRPEIETGLTALELLRSSPESLDWFYVSPPQDFGSWLGTPSKGAYVLGGDVLLRDADGASTISADDLALAIVDEVETAAHRRGRFTAIS